MLDYSENHQVTRMDYLASKEQPNPKAAGLTNADYQELISDKKVNRLAVNTVIDEYLDYFYNLSELRNLIQKLHDKEMLDPDILSGLKQPSFGETDSDSEDEPDDDDETVDHWTDSDILQKLIDGTNDLLSGRVTKENIYCARTLTSACFNEALEVISDQNVLLTEIANGELSFEDDTEEDVRGYIDSARKTIDEETVLLKKSLQANHYISQLLITQSSQ